MKKVVVYLRVEPELRDALVEISESIGVPVNTIARDLLAHALNLQAESERILSSVEGLNGRAAG